MAVINALHNLQPTTKPDIDYNNIATPINLENVCPTTTTTTTTTASQLDA